jgi:hypothetical protein
MIEVYDRARSHFLFEIVELQVKRYLNAERLKAEAEANPRVLLYSDYKDIFLERTQNSELTQDLLSYILKPREEGCPIYLWAAERILESKLLTASGLTMSDPAWLAYTLAFITPEERQVLQIPSLADRQTYDHGRGYTLVDLETAIDTMDVATLKRFRQAACTDPVAVQVLGLNRAKEGSSSAPRKPKFVPRTNSAPKESYATDLAPKQGKGKPRNHPSGNRNHQDSTKLDQISSLPHKDGKLDMDQYSKYKDGGLRQKLHDAIRARKCIRCMAVGHLRSSCPEPPKSWEADFNQGKAAFWGPKPKQSRPQWIQSSPHDPSRQGPMDLLFVTDAGRIIALDTCSEVSIGRIDSLKNVRLAQKPVCVEGIGGMRVLELEGEFSLVDNSEITLFCVEHSDLPPGTQALLGLSHVKSLALSLDFALLHPYCELRAAKEFARASLLWDCSAVSTLSSPSRERRCSALSCVGLFGLCLSLLLSYLAEDGKSGSHY